MTSSFLFLATVFLAAAVIAVPFFQRLGLGSVLGYLIAGVVIAPILAWLGVDAVAISHIAEFGVVMMLFLVGLELEPAKLWRLRGPILGVGGAQVLITAFVMMATGMVFGLDWRMGLALGLALALSSTAIVLQTLNEKNQLGTPTGQNSFSVLLFQDVAVIPILAALPFLAHPGGFASDYASTGDGHGNDGGGHGEDHGSASDALFDLTTMLPAWGQAMVSVAVIAGIVVAGRFLLRPVFRTVARTRIRELFTAVALLIVVGIAFLMGAIGLSAALGTFIAGVVLADSEYRHELEGDIEPFKGLLLGLFFITVGAQINFAILLAEPLVIAALLVGLVALKAAVVYALGTIIRLEQGNRITFALLLAQGGEFAFVLFGFMISEDVLPRSITERFTLVVALSMVVTPLLLMFNEMVIQPRLKAETAPRAEDRPDDENAVIIAGFGRVGTVITRFLLGQGIQATVLDNNPDQVEFMRRFGMKSFYGDPSRVDLLNSAGAGAARLLIVAVDDPGEAVKIVETARKNFPHLKIVARAKGRTDALSLTRAGAEGVVRETFDGALMIARQSLEMLGVKPYAARRAANKFKDYDLELLKEQIRSDFDNVDEAERIRRVRAIVDELESLFVQDSQSGKEALRDTWVNNPNAEDR